MKTEELTDSELLVLGLVAEMPRYGYELEQIIEQRSMREWTNIGFSSIYYVLNKLEKKDLVIAGAPMKLKARKIYELTEFGRKILVQQTLQTLKSVDPRYPALLLGMIHWPIVSRDQALGALNSRMQAVEEEMKRIEDIHCAQQPLPDYLDAIFEFSLGQLQTEANWIQNTLDYMKTKPWV